VVPVCYLRFRWLVAGVGNLFTITGRMNRALSPAGRKINSLYPKLQPLSNNEEEGLSHFLDKISKYLLIMELRFDAMLYSDLGNENSF